MAAQNVPTKAEIEQKIDSRTDLTDIEKEAAKAKLLEMLSVVTKASLASQDRKDQINRSWEIICVTSISSNNISNAIDMYARLEDDGTRLREIINKAYQNFNFLTPIDYMLNFIKALPTSHLKVAGIYALLSAMRQRVLSGNIKTLRVQEFVEEEVIPYLSESELKQNSLYGKLSEKVSKVVEDAVKMCVSNILEEKYGEIIFYARECPENFEKHVPEIVRGAYSVDHFEKVTNFVLALPTDTQKMAGMKELPQQVMEKMKEGKPDLSILEEKVKALENSSHFMDEIKTLSSTQDTKM